MKTISEALEEQMALENRRVLSSWRALVYLRRATEKIDESERRWGTCPRTVEEMDSILSRLRQFKKHPAGRSLYIPTSPFVQASLIVEEEIISEICPYAVFSNATSMQFHGMGEELSRAIHVDVPDRARSFTPIGMGRDEMAGIQLHMRKASFEDKDVKWHKIKSTFMEFGIDDYSPNGYPLKYTTKSRCLVDGLRHPDWNGGIKNVLKSWHEEEDAINVDEVLDITEMFEKIVLMKRVGFVLNSLGIDFGAREQEWRSKAKKGGSSLLSHGDKHEYGRLDEKWGLFINCSIPWEGEA